MATRTHSRVRTAAGCSLPACVVLAGYWLYHRWRDFEAAEQKELGDEKQWVYSRIQSSTVGSPSYMATVAQEFTRKSGVYVGSCEWYARPMRNHSIENPNWLSSIKKH